MDEKADTSYERMSVDTITGAIGTCFNRYMSQALDEAGLDGDDNSAQLYILNENITGFVKGLGQMLDKARRKAVYAVLWQSYQKHAEDGITPDPRLNAIINTYTDEERAAYDTSFEEAKQENERIREEQRKAMMDIIKAIMSGGSGKAEADDKTPPHIF